MTEAQAERAAIVAGVVTILAGPLLAVAPARCGAPLGMDGHAGVIRLIGFSDIATAPGLLFARPRWPWLVARAGLNVGLVAGARRYRDDLGPRNAAIGAAAFGALTLMDGAAAAVLRSAGR